MSDGLKISHPAPNVHSLLPDGFYRGDDHVRAGFVSGTVTETIDSSEKPVVERDVDLYGFVGR